MIFKTYKEANAYIGTLTIILSISIVPTGIKIIGTFNLTGILC